MKLITRFELAAKNTHELHALFRKVSDELAVSTPNTSTRRNALVSLENIQRELAERYQT